MYLRYYLGRDPATGKRIERFHRARSDRRREAEAELREILARRDRGEAFSVGTMTLGDYLERWLQEYAPGHLSPTTVEAYERAIRRRIIPLLGQVRLDRLNPMAISQAWRTLSRTHARRSVGVAHAVLHRALATAVSWGLLSRNPADGAAPPAPERYEAQLPTLSYLDRLLTHIQGTPLYLPVIVGLATGLRVSAICALRWEDVDLEAGTILSRASLARVRPEPGAERIFVLKSTKTGRIQRLRIPKFASDVLREYRQSHPEDVWLLPSARPDVPMDRLAIAKRWRQAAAAVGMPGVRFHDLRHWQASILYEGGLDLKAVSERLGHARLAMTDLYTHLLGRTEETAVTILEEVIGGVRRVTNEGVPGEEDDTDTISEVNSKANVVLG